MSILDEALSQAGKEFAAMQNHTIMDLLEWKQTCFVCHDDTKNHNKCRNRACHAQLLRRRKIEFT